MSAYFLSLLTETSWVEGLGWTLVHSLWLLMIPTVVFGLVLLAFPASWSRARYATGLVTLLAMVGLPVGGLLWVQTETAPHAPVAANSVGVHARLEPLDAGSEAAAELMDASDDDVAVSADLPTIELSGDPGDAAIVLVEPSPAVVAAEPVEAEATIAVGGGQSAETDFSILVAERIRPWLPWAVAIWLTGTLVMTLRLMAGWRTARRLKYEGRSTVPEFIQCAFEELRTSIGATKAAQVTQSALVNVPSVVGHFRPVVLLPISAVTGLNEQQLRAILAHELAHVRRYDYAVNVLQTAIETVLFYHPAVWWVSRIVRAEREHCCDDIALSVQCDASDLARALIAVDAVRGNAQGALAPGADGGHLLRRVRRLAGSPREDRATRRSWVAGLLVLSLLAVAGLFAVQTSVDAAADPFGQRQSSDDQTTSPEVPNATNNVITGSRIEFAGGYFVELTAVADYVRQQAATDVAGNDDGDNPPTVWDSQSNATQPPFAGTNNSSRADVDDGRIARKFYVTARVPVETSIAIDVEGEKFGGSGVTTTSWQGFATAEASCVAEFSRDQKTADVTVELGLPAWRTIASFDFAGGVHNGIIMDRESKVTEHTRLTATGDFGSSANNDNTRIIAFDRDHQRLKTSSSGAMSGGGKLKKLEAAYLNEKGRPDYIIVQRLAPTRKIIIRDVPLHPGSDTDVRCEIEGSTIGELSDSGTVPVTVLLEQTVAPLTATLPGLGTITLLGLQEAKENPGPGWYADGSARLAPPNVDLKPVLRSQASDNKRTLNAYFRFTPESGEVAISRTRVRPLDGTGTTTTKSSVDENGNRWNMVIGQAIDILDDRETDDIEITMFAGEPKPLTTLTIGEVPEDFDSNNRLLYDPADDVTNVAFQISQSRSGNRHTLMLVLPDEAPDGAKVTAITETGDRLLGSTNFTRGRKIIATFVVPDGQTLKSINVESVPQHRVTFRNVSMWSGLGSRAFVDVHHEPLSVEMSTAPTRIFLRPNGERFPERADSNAALEALNEIERRGGLLRFDAKSEAPDGKTLRYLTEVRWDDVRPDEVQLLKPLAGLHRVALSSEHVDDECLKSIEHLTSLQKFRISRSDHLTTACLKSVGKLTNLRELRPVSHLKWDDKAYTAADFEQLSGLTKLTHWEPYDWRMDDAGIAWLRNCDDLELLFGWAPELTDVGFAALTDKPKLEVIRLGETKITDASFKLLENHPTLYWIHCSSPNLTDAAIDSAITIRNVRDLHLDESKVSDAGIDRLIAAIDDLPKLTTVNVAGTQVSKAAADRLRAAKKGLRVLRGVDTATKPESDDGTKAEADSQPSASVEEPDAPIPDPETLTAPQKNELSATEVAKDHGVETAARNPQAAPSDVPWPVEQYESFTAYPPSGSGIRVKLDDRRWVELNSLSSFPKRDSGVPKVFWQPNGTLINPPDSFDPLSLVPDEEDGGMPEVTREAAIQIVGPTGIEFSLRAGGSGGYGKLNVPLIGEFTQIPIQYPLSGIKKNQTYIEARVTREEWESIPIEGNDAIRVVMAEEDHRMIVVADNAAAYSWKAEAKFEDDEDPRTIGPFITGADLDSQFLSEEMQQRLADSPPGNQAVIFSTWKKKPFPKILSLRRSRYDVVRFDNLAVFPGPKSAVKVSVNGVPVSEADRLTLVDSADVSPITPPEQKNDEAGFIDLVGTVVDSQGKPVPGCWVGMFVEPRSFNEGKADESAFEPALEFVMKATTDGEGRFTMLAPKDHFVFDGSFWAVQPNGTSGVQRLNCVWSYLQKNLKIKIDADTAVVKVVDPDGNPIVGAEVIPEAIRHNRRPSHHFPTRVQQKLKGVTDADGTIKILGWSSGGIRGIAVNAVGFGTQYLNPRTGSQWVQDGEPLTLTLRPVASVSGRVIGFDPQRDRGLKLQIRTEAYERGARPPLAGRAIVDVANDGRFTVPQIVEGYVSFDASTPPDADRKLRFASIPRLEIGENRVLPDDANPQIVNAVTVRQQLIKSDTGEGAADVRLRVLWGDALTHNGSWNSSRTTVTDADGWWEAKVLPGTINARINGIPKGYRSTAWFDGRNGYLGVAHEVPTTDKVVILPPEVYLPANELKGRLLLPDGKPAADWSAYGHPISWDDVGVGGVSTDRDGRFTWTYPVGYPPRLFKVSNREWLTEHKFKDNYAYPNVMSKNPFVLQVPNESDAASSENSDSD